MPIRRLVRPTALLPTYLGPVCTRCRISQNINSGTFSFTKRTYHWTRSGTTHVRIGYPAWYSNLTSGEAATGSVTIAAGLEFPFTTSTSGTTCKVVTWNGSTTATAASGVTTWSDLIPFATPPNSKFGTRFWINSTTSNPYNDATTTYIGAWRDAANGDVLDTSGTNLTAGGSMTDDGGQEDFTPFVVGYTRFPTVGIIGDSRQSGWGDTVDANVGDAGDVARTYGQTLNYWNLAVGGETAGSFITGSRSAQRRLLAAYCTHITTDMGVNDLDGGASTATTEANIITMLGMPGIVGKPVVYEGIYPESTSTDGWATTGNQTTVAWNSGIITLNTWFQSGAPRIVGFSDSRAIVANSIPAGIWKAPGITADGAHCTQTGYRNIQNGGGVNPNLITRRV